MRADWTGAVSPRSAYPLPSRFQTHRGGNTVQRTLKFLLVVPLFGLTTAAPVHAQTPTLQDLFTFTCTSTSCPDGKEPDALILASDGNLYGVAEYSNTATGVAGGGTIFKLTPAGQVTVLYTFPEN